MKSFKLCKIKARGVGLSFDERLQALKSGFKAVSILKCFVKNGFKDGVVGYELMSVDFKNKSFVNEKDIVEFEILASNLKELKNLNERGVV